jgi:hypothetical protein
MKIILLLIRVEIETMTILLILIINVYKIKQIFSGTPYCQSFTTLPMSTVSFCVQWHAHRVLNIGVRVCVSPPWWHNTGRSLNYHVNLQNSLFVVHLGKLNAQKVFVMFQHHKTSTLISPLNTILLLTLYLHKTAKLKFGWVQPFAYKVSSYLMLEMNRTWDAIAFLNKPILQSNPSWKEQ